MQNSQILFEKAVEARNHAYAPYSQFLVGCCLETESGKLFAGCNVENASYGVTLCAEGNAVCAMIAAGERKIKQLVVVTDTAMLSAPCGICRQRINEFADPDTLIHLFNLQGGHKQYQLKELLPHAFGPQNLYS